MTGFSENFIKLSANAANLAKYINDNCYLYVAIDFTISCKMVNKIFKHQIKFELVTVTTDVDKMAHCLEKEQEKFQQFCQDLDKNFKKITLKRLQNYLL